MDFEDEQNKRDSLSSGDSSHDSRDSPAASQGPAPDWAQAARRGQRLTDLTAGATAQQQRSQLPKNGAGSSGTGIASLVSPLSISGIADLHHNLQKFVDLHSIAAGHKRPLPKRQSPVIVIVQSRSLMILGTVIRRSAALICIVQLLCHFFVYALRRLLTHASARILPTCLYISSVESGLVPRLSAEWPDLHPTEMPASLYHLMLARLIWNVPDLATGLSTEWLQLPIVCVPVREFRDGGYGFLTADTATAAGGGDAAAARPAIVGFADRDDAQQVQWLWDSWPQTEDGANRCAPRLSQIW